MIRVDRQNVPAPAILLRSKGSKAEREFKAAAEFYSNYERNRQRGGFDFKLYRHSSVRKALHELFHGKCAYCETPLTTGPGDIEMYRPKSGVIADDGTHLPLHYWWLINEWSNLYLSCADCNRLSFRGSGDTKTRSGKGGRFPLKDEKLRAHPLDPIETLGDEQPLLLDPCNDDVETILLFSDDGLVSSKDIRGLTTIEILGLNRPGLVEARRSTARIVQMLLQTLQGYAGGSESDGFAQTIVTQLKEMMSPTAAYAGMCRQLVNAALAGLPSSEAAMLGNATALLGLRRRQTSRSEQRAAKVALTQFQSERESYSLEDDGEQGTTAYLRAGSRFVERIKAQNLRAISKLDLNVADTAGQAPWLMLLGENAAGKSTMLQALVLALVGDRYRNQLIDSLGLEPRTMVKAGASFGEISVKLSGATEPRVLRIYEDGRIETTGREAQLMLAAYGSTRLLPRRDGPKHQGTNYARVENLFDPFIPLVDAQEWLLEASPAEFDYAAIAIKKALAVDLDRQLVKRSGEVGLTEQGKFTPLARLCDGYQTVIALIADILSLVLPAWKTPELAQGLVLIDEVGNHLHPSWKLRFVESMRLILPGMQVVATTHEPLCLRGLRHGEVAVLRKGPRGGVKLVADLPPIEGLRVDQILTSEHFGLASTLDPSLQARFDRYYLLLRKKTPTQTESAEIVSLRAEINNAQQLGNNERERRLLDAIDRFLARRPELTAADIARGEEMLDDELSEIWSEAALLSGSAQ
ncbi:TIGR02646 family protein [Rhizobium aethiopicum]|uniref:TIGR02646 family protein n=1 Tax=Rhizobium aethiopicum TaxID=1138170 RepID=A0A1C3YCK0_9HYPH|nr:AAA family ATPase [Rhizobium aethiopicum]SCB62100.1 TIGR02646 family protein [Rhizobium aethiopicum]